MRRLISSGSRFEREIGFSRAVVDGEWIFVSGTTGFDYQEMTISDDILQQAKQCLANIDRACRRREAANPILSVSATSCPVPRTSSLAGRSFASTLQRCVLRQP